MRIDIAVFDGLDELDALGPAEVLRSAASLGADFKTRLVTRTPQTEVRGSYGLRFLPDGTYEPGADLLIVPGGGWAVHADIGVWGEAQRGDWLPLLRGAAEHAILAGVCSGTMLLAYAGLIGDRRATTHHSARADLGETGATVVTDRVVDEGEIITGGGVSSGIDLALWLVERFDSAKRADAVAKRMEYARPAERGERTLSRGKYGDSRFLGREL